MIKLRYPLKVLQEEVAYFPPIQNTANPYLTEAAMYADQANQLQGYGYLVDGVGAFTYLGTVAGTAADYEGFGGNLRLSNLAGDLSTAEKNGIKTKLSIVDGGITGEGTSGTYTTTLLFDNIFGKFLGTRNQIAGENFTLATTGNKIGATIHIHFISDGVNPINFTSGFDFLHGIDSGTILPAGNYEFYFVYKANNRVSVNVNKGVYKILSYAYKISGSSQNISFANAADFVKPLSGAFSVGYWVKSTANDGFFTLGIMSASGRTWTSTMSKSGGFGSDLAIFNSGGSQFIQQYVIANNLIDVYYFIVHTYDGSGTRAGINSYSDSVKENNNTENVGVTSITTINNVGSFSIGLFGTNQSKNAECAMAFYVNKVLTQAEITNAFQLGKSAKISELPFYVDILEGWDFENNLLSARETHNGTATTPIYIQI